MLVLSPPWYHHLLLIANVEYSNIEQGSFVLNHDFLLRTPIWSPALPMQIYLYCCMLLYPPYKPGQHLTNPFHHLSALPTSNQQMHPYHHLQSRQTPNHRIPPITLATDSCQQNSPFPLLPSPIYTPYPLLTPYLPTHPPHPHLPAESQL